MTDGIGIVQFINAMGEMAQGATAPSILPVWQRELLNARDPPRVTCTHYEFDEVADTNGGLSNASNGMTCCSFFFGSTQISTIRKFIPHYLRKCSRSEILTACIWRCQTIALQLNPDDDVRLIYIVYVRDRFCPPFFRRVLWQCNCSLSNSNYCWEALSESYRMRFRVLVKTAKANVSEEYARSLIDLMVIKSRPRLPMVRSYIVSDLTSVRSRDVNFGWGKAVYGGLAKVSQSLIKSLYIFTFH